MRLLANFRRFVLILPLLMLPATQLYAEGAPADKKPAPSEIDLLVLKNGDTVHGKLVQADSGTVLFHSAALGDLKVKWDDIKTLDAAESYTVLEKNQKVRGRREVAHLPTGSVSVADGVVTVHEKNAQGAPAPPIPVKNAQLIVDSAALDKQLNHQAGFLTGWNGAATAGATIVSATQNSYQVSGSVGLVRVIPTVTWLDSRNRTSANFNGSFGKITQPAYTSGGVFTPASTTKSSIVHFDAERDEYFSPRLYVLGQTAFDHNFSQDLNLQQIYGGGIGWTVVKTPIQEMDLKGTAQYENQQFITGASSANQSLIGSTFAGSYLLKLKLATFTQALAFIPAWNNTRAYSAQETDTFAFPAYKRFSLSVGTLDSYLNDPPATEPPTKRNSFQFTMGLTYAIKSTY
jgi:hypothetical protein